MTSGRKLTDADRMHILRHHAEGMQWVRPDDVAPDVIRAAARAAGGEG